MEAQLANTGKKVATPPVDGRYYGSFATVSEQGDQRIIETIRVRSFTWEDGFEGSEGASFDGDWRMTLPPDATATVRWLVVLPDAEVRSDQPLYFLMQPAESPATSDNPWLPPFAAYELAVPAAE